uniref:Methanethiol oxidase n=2 Tax=Acrobeloides nanus TaxID=290746 RepID=A0A914C719_9BILA
MQCCAHQNGLQNGPGYASPKDALRAPREKILFVTSVNVNPEDQHDALVTIDVDPASPTYCQVIGRVTVPYKLDEVHHLGWNACSSCYGNPLASRRYLVMPCLNSSRVYIVDTKDPTNLTIKKIIEPEELHKHDVSFPHTPHCLADGNVMISTLGDANGEKKGNFILIDGSTFDVKETWPAPDSPPQKFNYDFWYQPRLNVMVASEWGTPNKIKSGFKTEDLDAGEYGKQIHIYDWKEHKLVQTIELDGFEGWMPLEVRFLHEPSKAHCFYGTCLGSSIYHLYKDETTGKWVNRLAYKVEVKKVSGWVMEEISGNITYIIISMDDRYLYASCFLFGEILQLDISDPFDVKLVGKLDISDPFDVKLVGKVKLGGLLHSESSVKLANGEDQPKPLYVKGKRIEGGPQMLQLSLDGKRLYVTNSAYSIWDKDTYPDLYKNGSQLLQIDVDTENGGMKVNENCLVDFGKLPNGPFLAHEMRYPGGDCTSDIWI